MNDPMNILIIMPVSIGDIVLTTPVLHQLRLKYPKSTINYAVQKGHYAQILKNNEDIDKIILLEQDYLHAISAGDYLKALKSDIKKISDFDLIINLRDNNGHVRQNALNGKHVVYYFAKKAGVEINDIRPKLYISNSNLEAANKILLENNINNKIVIIAPYCGFNRSENNNRCWPTDNFIYIMENLKKKSDISFVVIGARNDKPIEFSNTINVFGYDLLTVAALIKKSSLFIGVDSGVTHMAAGCGVPIVDILFPGLPELWHPATHEPFVVFSSRRKIRNYTSTNNCKKEKVLKYCCELLEGSIKTQKFVRFYPWN